LVDIGKRTTQIDDIEGQYMGLLKFTPKAWSAVEAVIAAVDAKTRGAMDMTTLLRALLGLGFPVSTVGTSGQWGEIDSVTDLELYEKMIKAGDLSLEN
jgi:choline kinase